MTLRIYKNEYESRHIDFIRTNFTVVEESENVLAIAGTEEILNNVMQGMMTSDEQFKAIFPDFRTLAERQAYTDEQICATKKSLQNTLCMIASYGAFTEESYVEFDKLRQAYMNLK